MQLHNTNLCTNLPLFVQLHKYYPKNCATAQLYSIHTIINTTLTQHKHNINTFYKLHSKQTQKEKQKKKDETKKKRLTALTQTNIFHKQKEKKRKKKRN